MNIHINYEAMMAIMAVCICVAICVDKIYSKRKR